MNMLRKSNLCLLSQGPLNSFGVGCRLAVAVAGESNKFLCTSYVRRSEEALVQLTGSPWDRLQFELRVAVKFGEGITDTSDSANHTA